VHDAAVCLRQLRRQIAQKNAQERSAHCACRNSCHDHPFDQVGELAVEFCAHFRETRVSLGLSEREAGVDLLLQGRKTRQFPRVRFRKAAHLLRIRFRETRQLPRIRFRETRRLLRIGFREACIHVAPDRTEPRVELFSAHFFMSMGLTSPVRVRQGAHGSERARHLLTIRYYLSRSVFVVRTGANEGCIRRCCCLASSVAVDNDSIAEASH
jgi:hypothetical protein